MLVASLVAALLGALKAFAALRQARRAQPLRHRARRLVSECPTALEQLAAVIAEGHSAALAKCANAVVVERPLVINRFLIA